MPSSTVAAAASVERPSPRSLRCTRSETVNGQKPSQAIESSLPLLSAAFASPVVGPPSSLDGSQVPADSLLAGGSALLAVLLLAFFAFFLESADLLVRRFSRLSFSATGSVLLPN